MTRKKNNDGQSEIIEFERAKAELKERLEASGKELDTVALFDTDVILKRMNNDHSFIKSIGGTPMVTAMIYNEVTNKRALELLSPDAISTIYQNESVQEGKSSIELGKWWLRHSDRKTYETIIFDPSKPKEFNNCLNLWEGFAVEPTKHSWKKTRTHIYKILCNKNKTKFKYFIKWLAWCVQNPAHQAEVCCIFKGKEGAGKGFIFTQFVELFGLHGFTLANRELLTGKHNGHLFRCVFLFADEAYYPGDKEAEGVLKQLITQPFISYRAMRRDAVMGPNRLHIGMSTNNDWVIPAGQDARRYFINAVDNKYAKGECTDSIRSKYFSELWGEMQNGGRAGMLSDLLSIKLGKWHPRDNVPDTEELANQKQMNLNSLEQTLFDILDDGIFPGVYNNEIYSIGSEHFIDWIHKLEPRTLRFSTVKKTEILKKLGATKRRTSSKILWDFLELNAMRENWNKHFNKVKWNSQKEWQIKKAEF